MLLILNNILILHTNVARLVILNIIQVKVDSAYKTLTDIGSSTKVQDLYAAAGTGAVLSVTSTAPPTVTLPAIAEAALMFCPSIFAVSCTKKV